MRPFGAGIPNGCCQQRSRRVLSTALLQRAVFCCVDANRTLDRTLSSISRRFCVAQLPSIKNARLGMSFVTFGPGNVVCHIWLRECRLSHLAPGMSFVT